MQVRSKPTWGVCATVHETTEMLELFIRHYLALGASQIVFFLDEPDPVQMEVLSRYQNVSCLPSSPHLLDDGSLASHEKTQGQNYLKALRDHFHTDWCGHVDADELLCPLDQPISFSEFLDNLAPEVKCIQIAPCEAVFGPGDEPSKVFGASYARLIVDCKIAENEVLINETYTELAKKLINSGLTGHNNGKCFLRSNSKFSDIGLHRVIPVDGQSLLIANRDFAILHFDASHFQGWSEKWMKRAENRVTMKNMTRRRRLLLEEFRKSGAVEQKMWHLFASLYVLDRSQLDMLSSAGFVRRICGLGTQLPFLGAHVTANEGRPVPNGPSGVVSTTAFEKNRKQEGSEYQRAITEVDRSIIQSMRDSIEASDFEGYRAAFDRIGNDRFLDRRVKVFRDVNVMTKRVVFIAGLHRSGTTLLESLLHSKFDVRVLRGKVPENEGQFFQDVMRAEVAYGGPGFFAFFNQMHLPAVIDISAARNFRQTLLEEWEYWAQGNSDVLLEKSPPNITRIPYLRSVFPEAKFIILVRDPRAVVMSVKKWNRSPKEVLFMNWCAAYSAALGHAEKDCIFVRYEDLCANPNEQLNRLADFANLTKRSSETFFQPRFADVHNSNASYISRFGLLPETMKRRLVFRPWEIFGYDLDENFKAAEAVSEPKSESKNFGKRWTRLWSRLRNPKRG